MSSPSQPNSLGLYRGKDLEKLNEILAWIRDFVAEPHPDLGRTGPVCPFIPHALRENTIWLAAPAASLDEMDKLIHEYRHEFTKLDPTTGPLLPYKTIVLVFPAVTREQAPELIDKLQWRVKPEFVADGLMIGQFHPDNNEPGVHNSDFRPLRSPVPLLVIRAMVGTDLPFLTDRRQAPERRVRLVLGYLKSMEKLLPGPQHTRTRDLAENLALILEEILDELAHSPPDEVNEEQP
jgi:hypothetical protein